MQEVTQLLQDLKQKKYKPIYFLCGEESYFIHELSDYIEAHVLDEFEKEFNQTILYGKETDLPTIISSAKRFPMGSAYQVIIVKEAQHIKISSAGASSPDNEEDTEADTKTTKDKSKNPFVDYVNNPQPTTILVFCYHQKTLDKRSALYKQLTKNNIYLETKKMYDNQIPDWISKILSAKKIKINPKASFLLAERLGNDLSKINNELTKLTLNLKPNEEISIEMISEMIGISKEYNIFELQNAISKKNIIMSMRITNYFATNEKDHPLVMLLSSLYGYFTKILVCHFTADKSKFAIAQALGVNPFFADDYILASKNYNTLKLKHIFGYLKEYDLKSKGVDTGQVKQGELLKELMFKILH